MQIHTPVGAIGLRGTTVWGGPIDKGYGVIVLNGEVTVTGRRGTVTLRQGQGTMLFGDGKPRRAAPWPAGRLKRAVASISFRNPLGGRERLRSLGSRALPYYLPDGDFEEVEVHKVGGDAPEFSAEGVEKAVRAIQRQEIAYRNFCRMIADSGC